MLTAPTLKPGQTPYDPATTPITNPTPTTQPLPQSLTPEDILSHSLVKDTLTTLHQEDNTHYATLQQRTSHSLTTLQKDHETFLNNQKNKFKNLFSTPQQKQLFLTISAPYFIWSTNRAHTLYLQKIAQFRQETIDRQNTELLSLILAPETLFDNQTQTTYRNMILHNIETSLAHLSKSDQQQHLDQASQTLYRKIIEKRLESDPTQLAPLLESPPVKRLLPKPELDNYKSLATQAARTNQLKTTAQQWLTQNITEKTANDLLKSSTKTETEAAELKSIYTQLKFNQNRKQCLTKLLNLMNVWTLILENDAKPESIPNWVTHTDPTLNNYLTKTLRQRQQQGGQPATPDYTALIDFIANYDPEKTMRHLTNDKELYSLVSQTGGADSDSFGILLRFILGSLDDSDTAWIKAVQLAVNFLHKQYGENPDKTQNNDFIHRFTAIRQSRMAKQDGTPLDELEMQSILLDMIKW